MPFYMTQVAYTSETWAGLVKQPQDRSRAVRRFAKSLKGRIVSFYNSFGEYDAVIIAELPDNEAAAAIAIAAAGGGALKAIKTTPLMTAKEGLSAMRKAKRVGYAPPK